jgi:DNA-directed RNA polymerase I subunit RPA1
MIQGEESIIQTRFNGTEFGFYTYEEIKKLSVKKIVAPIAFDDIGQPVRGGICDPAMGPSVFDKLAKCETCGLESSICNGHPGHVEFVAPLYNPFLLNILFKLLKSKCFDCHRLRIPAIK